MDNDDLTAIPSFLDRRIQEEADEPSDIGNPLKSDAAPTKKADDVRPSDAATADRQCIHVNQKSDNRRNQMTDNTSTPVDIIQKNQDALAAFEAEGNETLRDYKSFLKFTQGDGWVFGPDENEITEDDQFAVEMASYSTGHICWVDGEPIDEVMEPVALGKKVIKAELPKHGPFEDKGDGWKAQTSVDMQLLNDGTDLHYAATSVGGRMALKLLSKAYAERLKIGGDDVVPIVQLSGDSYKHKKHGKVATPIIEIVGWTNEETLLNADTDSSPQNVEEEEPASKKRKSTSFKAGDDRKRRLET